MIRGIRFNVFNEYDSMLAKITKDIFIRKYYWYSVENEDQVFNKNNEFLFDTEILDGESFEQKVCLSEYYLVSAKLQAYLAQDIIYEIKSFNQFINSNCEIMILVVDTIFVNVYAKDLNIVEIIKSNAESNSYTNIEYITDENDKLET